MDTMDTIGAIATGACKSAIGIIRISGPQAFHAVGRIFTPLTPQGREDFPPRTMVYGTLRDQRGHIIDRCLCVRFPGPSSYTGEDCAELHCHGSPMLLSLGLEALFSHGVRQARAGEFTQRAFLNGRMDLSEAEAVADLIDSTTGKAAINAAGQLGGALRRRLETIYSLVLGMISHFQAEVDYPDEDVDPLDRAEIYQTLEEAIRELQELGESYSHGKILKDGAPAVIIGRPNVGKSSILNALLGYERAIVTSTAGTTRDSICESILLGDTLLRLSDTAGIRQSSNEIERLGITRALELAKEAEIAYAVFDGSRELTADDENTARAALAAPKQIAIINKSDLPQKIDTDRIRRLFKHVCHISALRREGLQKLGALTDGLLCGAVNRAEGEILTNLRQATAVRAACDCLNGALGALRSGLTPDAALCDAEAALEHIGELTGTSLRDDIQAQIFSRFCVGK